MAHNKEMLAMARGVLAGFVQGLEREEGERAIRQMYEFSMIFTVEAHKCLARFRKERKECPTTEPS